MKYSVEVMRVREQTIQLNGWAVESNPDSVITYRVEDEAGQPVKAKIVPTRRDDVSQIYYKKIIDRDLGFDIRFPYEHGKNYYLVICGGKKTTRVKYSDMAIRRKTGAGNLLENAIEELSAGSPEIREITLGIYCDPGCNIITCEDTGRGIRPDLIDSPCCLGFLKGKWPEGPDLKIQAQDPGN